jgi:hypothetical protein
LLCYLRANVAVEDPVMDSVKRDHRLSAAVFAATMTQGSLQPRRRNKGPVKKPPDRPQPLPDGGIHA